MTLDPENIRRALSDQIRVELVDKGITQRELAERIGITTGALSRYMQGHREMPMTTYLAISDALILGPDELMRSAVARSRR